MNVTRMKLTETTFQIATQIAVELYDTVDWQL